MERKEWLDSNEGPASSNSDNRLACDHFLACVVATAIREQSSNLSVVSSSIHSISPKIRREAGRCGNPAMRLSPRKLGCQGPRLKEPRQSPATGIWSCAELVSIFAVHGLARLGTQACLTEVSEAPPLWLTPRAFSCYLPVGKSILAVLLGFCFHLARLPFYLARC